MGSVNLEEILKSKLESYSDGNGFYGFASFVNQDQINLVLEAMKDACNQTIDLCSVNAICGYDNHDSFIAGNETYIVFKDSILNTKKQIV